DGPDKGLPAHMVSEPDHAGRPQLLHGGSHVQTPTSHSDSTAMPAHTTVAIAVHPSVHESAPIVEPVQAGPAVDWPVVYSAEGAQQSKLILRNESGMPTGPEILVAEKSTADVAPAIVGLGDGMVAAAYVDARDGTLVVEAFGGEGAQARAPVVDAGATGAI